MDKNPALLYILDTSALRSLSREALRTAVLAGHDVAVGVMVVYEVFRHLDDGNGDPAAFDLCKAELMKARELQILPAAGAVQAEAVGAAHLAHPGQFKEPASLKELLDTLFLCCSLKDFSSRWIWVTSGQLRQVEDFARRAREGFAKRQLEFREQLERLRSLLAEIGIRKAELRELGTAQYWDYMKATLMGISTPRGAGVDEGELLRRLFCSSYLHFAYLLWRLRLYILNVGEKQPLNISPNDMADAEASWYVNLRKPHRLVVDDKGMSGTLAEAFRRLDANQWPGVVPEKPLARVIDSEQFRSETSEGV